MHQNIKRHMFKTYYEAIQFLYNCLMSSFHDGLNDNSSEPYIDESDPFENIHDSKVNAIVRLYETTKHQVGCDLVKLTNKLWYNIEPEKQCQVTVERNVLAVQTATIIVKASMQNIKKIKKQVNDYIIKDMASWTMVPGSVVEQGKFTIEEIIKA